MAFPNIYRLYDESVILPNKEYKIIGRIFDYDIEIELKDGKEAKKLINNQYIQH
ncbi:MAG: hypothetical protein HOA66_05650 [Candidatus Marinimicrobia bacterium]|jgi:hypothetical protein|nr:hypothetical protein [Candidatus Neomarinimicrobiota bacterium]